MRAGSTTIAIANGRIRACAHAKAGTMSDSAVGPWASDLVAVPRPQLARLLGVFEAQMQASALSTEVEQAYRVVAGAAKGPRVSPPPQRPPFGYRLEQGRLVADVGEQRTVWALLRLRQGGLSLRAVAGQLNDAKLFRRGGRPWRGEDVRRVLERERARVG